MIFQSPQSGICFCERGTQSTSAHRHCLSIPSIWDLLLRADMTTRPLGTQASFNPLNLGSASARSPVRPEGRTVGWSLSIPSIWDLLLRAEQARDFVDPHVVGFQSPQSGICFCEDVEDFSITDAWYIFQSPQSGICFCELPKATDGNFMCSLSIPSIWDLLLRG